MMLSGRILCPRCGEISPGVVIGIFLSLAVLPQTWGAGEGTYGYFAHVNNSAVLLTQTVWNVLSPSPTGFSFRTCSDGELLHQNGSNGDFLNLLLVNGTLEFHYSVGVNSSFIVIGQNFNNNDWYTVNYQIYLGNLYLNISKGGNVKFSEIISNDTFRTHLRSIDLTGSEGLHVGRGYTGCFMEGPNVQFTNNVHIWWTNVEWSDTSCRQSDTGCASGDIDACISQPCLNGGTCHDTIDSYTCSCAHLFNGTNCENDLAIYGCQVDPCLNGGTCVEDATSSNNYRCECRQGYAGSNCEADIDECGFTPCHNGVPCADLVGTFSCNCTGSGYSGELCDQDIDECDTANICGAQGTCFNNPGSYTCGCPPGEFGNPCQDINECQSSPCRHSGTCQNLDNEYNCVCVPGYRGKQCEEDIDDCIGAVCPAQYSECRDLVNNHSCVCKAGYRGTPPTCQDINECDPDPCQHGSTCADQVNAYHCACIAGYEGPTCATNINDCDPDLCLNGASCVDHVNNYTCTCVAGFEGRHCETNINECDKFATPCHNGGTCHDQVNGFNCSCVHGYTGSICQENINECDPDPCVATHSSGCTDGVGVFTCSCLPGYNGDRCEADINECWPNLCQNGATCTDLVNGYNCTCLPDWMGERCELVYDACIPEFANCENGANCSTTPPSKQFSCMCVVGFDGQRCERNIDDCQPDPCQLPHVCYDGVNSHTCACNIGYEGTNCDHLIDECRSTPCSNGATCNSGIGVYTCECPQLNVTIPLTDRWFITGYHGDNCEIDIDECTITPPICLNNGRCENMDGDFQCFCGRDQQGNLYFTGNHCELEISYCSIADDLPACKNNGTCIAEVRDFRCECAAGFKGLRCEIDINECESNPCHWNGTCEDRIAAYVCSCIDGITGPNCETNIDECESNPCLQEAPCIDGINEFTCNCTDTGFKGDTCEINIDDCEPQPCQHGATCYDKIKDYDCHCFPGYSGKNCETDINECLNNPCDDTYPGTCYEKSNETNYEVDTAGFENLNFSFANAAGYICQCIKGITGTNCTENINDCVDDNCHNGTCHDLIDAYECVCHPGYEGTNCDTEINECLRYEPCGDRGICTDKIDDYECDCNLMYNAGKNCTFRLTSCDSHNCQNGASCTPFLVDELTSQQDYSCVCSTGFTGHYCDVSTTMSFSSGSYIHVTLDSTTDVLMSFRFRTTLQDSLLLAWQGADTTGLFSTVELKNGALHLLYHDPTQVGVLSKISIPKVFSNAEWQTVTLSINTDTSFLTFKVESSSCTNEYECIRMANYDSQILAFQSIYMGNINDAALLSSTESGTRFVGCMEDVTYAGNKLVLDPNSLMFHQLANGCPRQEQCFPDTCNNKGHCVDMWNEFVCNCRRPNLGTTCDTSYTAATFAYNNAISSATFTLPQAQTDALKLNMDLSFFLRSRKPNGLILFLGNVNSNFLSVELLDGKIAVRMKFCGTEEFIFSTDNAYTDGEQHFVEIVRQDGDMNLSVDGVFNSGKQFSSNCILDVSSILFGDPSEIQNGVRKRRQAVTAPVEDFASATYFKGTIQDVQLNTNSLQFYPLSDPSLSNLPKILLSESASLEENEKTDPICDMVSPCEKNSTCSDVFYNDYSCDCLHGYRGKNCSDLDFCVTGECPAGSTCHSLLDGFECISVSTFDGLQSLAWYDHTLSNTSTIETISIKFRTLAYNGRILQIDNGDSRYYKVKVVGSHVVVVYNLDGSEMSLEAQYDISDSQWYMAVVKETHDTVTLTLYENDQVLSNVSSSKPTTGDNLTSLLRDGAKRIILGRVSDSPGDPRIPNYHGCLTEVRIGKILLPFFYDDNFINDTSVERFLLTKRNQIPVGCIAGTDTNCPRNQCHHGSDCIPDYYSYRCNCSAGYDGRWCQDRRDYCMVDSCENGHCVSRTDIYECECPSGYTGSRCQTDVDECATGVCQNNATCYNQNGTYTCNCSDLYTGDNCEIQLNRTCSDSPCEHGRTCTNITITDGATGLDVESFNCSCNPGYHGYTCAVAIDYCENFPCQNGATCNSWTENQDFNCTCANGYSGDTCDVNIDDCPSQTLCLHGGVCVDGLMTHVCNCTDTVYWTGERCEVDIDECTIQQPCQNGTSCLNKDEGYKCNCTNTGYQGIHCADDIDECTTANPCLKEANCTNTIGSYDCSCTVGYEGKDCGIANCTDVPCVNGATCVEIFTNTQWRCSCPTYYEGTYCQVKGPCADEPCENNNTDTCTQDVTADTYTCHCGQGWEGTNCTTDIDECTVTSGICQNGATCVNLDGSYRCDCVFGYNGTNCEKNIDECAGRPCHNHGICIDGVGGFTCNCTETGYTNLTCMEDVNECEESEPCLHDGTCNNTVGSYECACKETYEGKDCEIKRDAIMEDDDITWFIVGPSVAVVLILIVIGVIWFLMCVRTKRATRGAYSPSRQEVTGSRVELGNVLKKPPPERLI